MFDIQSLHLEGPRWMIGFLVVIFCAGFYQAFVVVIGLFGWKFELARWSIVATKSSADRPEEAE